MIQPTNINFKNIEKNNQKKDYSLLTSIGVIGAGTAGGYAKHHFGDYRKKKIAELQNSPSLKLMTDELTLKYNYNFIMNLLNENWAVEYATNCEKLSEVAEKYDNNNKNIAKTVKDIVWLKDKYNENLKSFEVLPKNNRKFRKYKIEQNLMLRKNKNLLSGGILGTSLAGLLLLIKGLKGDDKNDKLSLGVGSTLLGFSAGGLAHLANADKKLASIVKNNTTMYYKELKKCIKDITDKMYFGYNEEKIPELKLRNIEEFLQPADFDEYITKKNDLKIKYNLEILPKEIDKFVKSAWKKIGIGAGIGLVVGSIAIMIKNVTAKNENKSN